MHATSLPQYLRYDPESGKLYRPDGSEAVGYIKDGYRVVSVKGRQYFAHRLAFALMCGRWLNVIDHVNRNRTDNRWVNLREANKAGNAKNAGLRKDSQSGYRGVSYRKSNGKWRAYIQADGVQHHLGFYATAEEAHLARQAVISQHHKHFSNEV